MNKTSSNLINTWLVFLALIILSMIAVGGLTRLTESGLSMVDWNLFMGIIPPLNQSDWIKLFEDYKQYPEYQIKNSNMSLDGFKYIFYWEYGHRVLGRIIGIIFLIPFIYFSIKKYFSKSEYYFYIILLFLGATQGLIGWWMVKSGLNLNPYVSHVRLAVHLILAQIIISLIIYQLLIRTSDLSYEKINKNHFYFMLMFNLMIFFTVIYGAFMAGLDAGQSFNTWPKMGESYIPENLIIWGSKIWGIFENSVFIHFFHRFLAYLSLFLILIISYFHIKKITNKRQKSHLIAILFFVILQLIIGIYVVLLNVPISLGALHQIIGTIVFVLSSTYTLSLIRS